MHLAFESKAWQRFGEMSLAAKSKTTAWRITTTRKHYAPVPRLKQAKTLAGGFSGWKSGSTDGTIATVEPIEAVL